MTEQEFSELDTRQKWQYIKRIMDYIESTEKLYLLRDRLNPHHNKKDKAQERRNLRQDQYERWSHVKDLYAIHRDELVNTLDEPDFEKCKSIIEQVFTLELDDALQDAIND